MVRRGIVAGFRGNGIIRRARVHDLWKWIEDIRTLYRLNTARLAVWDATVPLNGQAPAFVARQHDLTTHLGEMQSRCEMYRQERYLHQAKRPILESLHHHWGGLTVFLTRPEVALDNNSAERALRTQIGRAHV